MALRREGSTVTRDRGFGAVGLLVSLLVLGALAAVALVSLPGGGAPNVTLPTATTHAAGKEAGASHAKQVGPVQPAAVPALGNEISSAAVEACRADYSAVEAGVSYYQAENGSLPTGLASLKSLLRGSVASRYFTIAIDPGHPGLVEVGARGHPLAPGEANCSYAGY
jgi:N-acetylmuramoyl-L-alanine amidase